MSIKCQFRIALAGAFIAAVASSGFAAADSDQAIIERIKPIGEVCIEGQPCPAESAAVAVTASEAVAEPAPEPIAAAEVVEEAAVPAEPQAAAPAAVASSGRSGADVYNSSCVACHSTGLAGAPKPGDADAWKPRLANGADTVLKHAIHGLNAMPPKGTCANCTDEELQAAIDYMTAGIN